MTARRMVEVNRVREVLRDHWLSGIVCDHEARTDAAACYCCRWRSPVLESPAAAAHAWIDHVIDEILRPSGEPEASPTRKPDLKPGAEA